MANHTNSNRISKIKVTNGDVRDIHDNAALHESSEIVFNDTDDTSFKDQMMAHVAENLRDYAMLTLEDGQYLDTESEYGKILITPLGNFVISESTLQYNRTDEDKFKKPSLDYVNEHQTYADQTEQYKADQMQDIVSKLDFDALPESFKHALLKYVVDNWPSAAEGLFLIADKASTK